MNRTNQHRRRGIGARQASGLMLVAGLAVVPAFASPQAQVAVPQEALRYVRVVATGGTIAGRAAGPGQLSGYRSGVIPVEELLAVVPDINEIANVSAEQYSNVGSTSLLPSDWLALAQRINVLFTEGVDGHAVDGVVVTHGTDALEETAYFLNLTVRSDKPVVIVGAMRPATAVSADGPLNLMNAIQVAADERARGRGALVVLNQEINAARDATKTNALRVQTFQSRVWGALGTVDPDGPVFYRRLEKRHTADSEFDVSGLSAEELPRVDISYTYNGADGTDIRAFAAAGARGVIIAGSGGGATTRAQSEAADEVAEQGVIVVRSSRTGSGRVRGGRGNSVAADDLTPQKARILLMVALAHTDDPAELRRIFTSY